MITTGILAYSRHRASASPVIPSGRIWPCGDFGLGYRKKLERALTTTVPAYVHPSGENLGRIFGVWAAMQDGAVALGLSVLRNSHKPKKPRPETYGRNGITGYGRKFVKSAATILQRDYGKERLSFLTLTVPEVEGAALELIAANWGRLVDRLLQHLGRQLEKAGLPKSIVAVTELQPKRLSNGSLGALHLHLVFVGRPRQGRWVVRPLEIREWWLGALGRVAGRQIVSCSCENLQAVKKDAGAYLAKYMSKGTGDVAAFAEIAGWNCVPRQWWNVTKLMRSMVKKEILSGEFTMGILGAHIDMEKGREVPRGFKYLGQVTIPVEPGREERRGAGWFGTLERGFLRELTALSRDYRDSLAQDWGTLAVG